MIKKLICPTDFSDAAHNATEYAAKMAQLFNAELLFVNVNSVSPVAAAVSMAEGMSLHRNENLGAAAGRLEELCTEVNKIFKISTTYEVDVTSKSLEMVLSGLDASNSLIVIGTNGCDDIFQQLFGSHSFNVIRNVQCPVLVVPENAFYGHIHKITYAWGEEMENHFSFSLLGYFREIMNPEFVFLHISHRGRDTNRDIYASLRAEVVKVFGEKPGVDFDQVFSDDIPYTISQYMKTSGSDILALNYQKKGPVSQWFFTSAIRKLVETIPYPILVMQL